MQRFVGKIRRWMLIIIAFSVLIYSLWMIANRLWMQKNSNELYETTLTMVQQHRESSQLNQEDTVPFPPALESETVVNAVKSRVEVRTYPFEELSLNNPDTVGWIVVGDTKVDYPVVRTTNNAYYLTHAFDRTKNIAGAIFMDYRNTDGEEEKNTVLYGHRMKNGSMFDQLTKYTDEDFFKAHRVITFDTLEGNQNWEVFSVYVSDLEFDYIRTEFDDRSFDSFLNEIQSMSLYTTDVRLSASDRILTLSTCDYTFDNARLVMHARLLNAEEGI